MLWVLYPKKCKIEKCCVGWVSLKWGNRHPNGSSSLPNCVHVHLYISTHTYTHWHMYLWLHNMQIDVYTSPLVLPKYWLILCQEEREGKKKEKKKWKVRRESQMRKAKESIVEREKWADKEFTASSLQACPSGLSQSRWRRAYCFLHKSWGATQPDRGALYSSYS